MNPYDAYLQKHYEGRTWPSEFPWSLEINGKIVGALALACVSGTMFFCWFDPNAAFAEFEADFTASNEETRAYVLSAPAFTRQGDAHVRIAEGFKRDEALAKRLLALRCLVHDDLFGKPVINALSVGIEGGYAWFWPAHAAAAIPLPTPESLAEEAGGSGTEQVWALKRGAQTLGYLTLAEADQPWFICTFKPGPDFEAYRHLFENDIAEMNAPKRNQSAVQKVMEAIGGLALTLESLTSETEVPEVLALHVDGVRAWFRPHFR